MDAFGVLGKVLDDYQSFVSGFLNIKDPEVKAKVESEIENGLLWPEPWLALNPAFEPGGTVSELVDSNVPYPLIARFSAPAPTRTLRPRNRLPPAPERRVRHRPTRRVVRPDHRHGLG
ncbi:hypothetical protein GCM10020255_040380 [Rhodococcus baikonurensis]